MKTYKIQYGDIVEYRDAEDCESAMESIIEESPDNFYNFKIKMIDADTRGKIWLRGNIQYAPDTDNLEDWDIVGITIDSL